MHDCALGRGGEPSAPRVEHRFYERKILVKSQKVNFPQIAIITQGTFWTFLTL